MLDARELIEAIMLDFGLDPPAGRSKPYLLRDFAQFLVDQRRAGRLPLLIIDEAQNLSLAALEEIRMLSNLETEKSKLIQIVLVGQPNLHEMLGRPELEQLRQRVTVRYHLRPLDPGETAAYIHHRLRKAAVGAPLVFSSDVTDLIGRSSQGVPRTINVIADAVLLFGYGEDKRIIDAALTREVIAELEATGVIKAAGPTVPTASPAVTAPPPAPPADRTAREVVSALREAQLAEQRRVLTEQYRLNMRRESQAAATVRANAPLPSKPAPTSSTICTPAPRTITAIRPPEAAPSVTAAHGIRDASRPGLWARVRRGLFGLGRPLLED
jgi:hypothetical protein